MLRPSATFSIPNNPIPGEDHFLARWDFYIQNTANAFAGKDYDVAQDLAQEARLRVLAAFRAGAPTTRSYGKRLVRNAILNALRDERLHRARVEHAGVVADGIEAEPSADERSDLLAVRQVRAWR